MKMFKSNATGNTLTGAFAAFAATLALYACGQSAPSATSTPVATTLLAGIPVCGEGDPVTPDPDHPFPPRECKIAANGDTLHVKFQAVAADAKSGVVAVDVIGPNGAVRQTFSEPEVDNYADPVAADFDHDGHLDLETIMTQGNDNNTWGMWRFDPVSSHYVRVGEVSGYGVDTTADGFIAVPNRGSAADYGVDFYRIDANTLTPLASIAMHAEGDDQGNVTSHTCTLSASGAGFASLHLTVDAAQTKFCAEPSAKVFDQ